MQPLAYLPSPSDGVWHLGPLPLRAYALMIILGIVVAIWLGERRWAARGGSPNVVVDVAVWTVPFGLVGGRLYHVITDYGRYFGDGQDPVNVLKIWHGGLGIWGAVALGAVGAWIGCRRRGISLGAFGDAVAPGIALAQAIGRWGNWWNQELYGRPLDTWWAVKIDAAHRPADPKYADIATYHPTFLYEFLWCIGVAVLVIWAGRRFNLTHGRTFALYAAAYTVGRFWIESLRIDEAHHFLGMRLNNWTALVVFLGAVAYIWLARGRTDEECVTVKGHYAEAVSPAEAEPTTAPELATVPAGEKSEAGSAGGGTAPATGGADSPGDGTAVPAGASGEDTGDAVAGEPGEASGEDAGDGVAEEPGEERRDPPGDESGDESAAPAAEETRAGAGEGAGEGDLLEKTERPAKEAADKEPS